MKPRRASTHRHTTACKGGLQARAHSLKSLKGDSPRVGRDAVAAVGDERDAVAVAQGGVGFFGLVPLQHRWRQWRRMH